VTVSDSPKLDLKLSIGMTWSLLVAGWLLFATSCFLPCINSPRPISGLWMLLECFFIATFQLNLTGGIPIQVRLDSMFISLATILLILSPVILGLRHKPLVAKLIWTYPVLLSIWLLPVFVDSKVHFTWGFYVCALSYTLVFTAVYFSPPVRRPQERGFEVLAPSRADRGDVIN
jgi:hypothetical protein